MPVDPYIQAMLKQMATLPQAQSLQELRNPAQAGALPARPVQIGLVRDLSVPGPVSSLPARLYTPAGQAPASGWPLTVFYHGGGFALGDLTSHDSLCRELCASGQVAVLAIEYRLAPEHPFPAGVDDAYAAYRWAADHATDLGADPARLAVAGDSAGANLSIVVALRVRDEGGLPPRAQLLLYPSTDFVTESASRRDNAEGYFLTGTMMRLFGQAYLSDPAQAKHPHASPAFADLHDLPPALVMTAEFDPLRDEGEAFQRALVAAGNHAELIQGPGMVHGYASMSGFVPAAAALVDRGGAWLGEQLRA